jgi:methylthioribose-1-phosphate isomerase
MMNHEFVVAAAADLAARVEREAGPEPAARVERAWRLTLGTRPTAAQLRVALDLLQRQQADLAADHNQPGAAPRRALASVCQALLGCNAFLYVD